MYTNFIILYLFLVIPIYQKIKKLSDKQSTENSWKLLFIFVLLVDFSSSLFVTHFSKGNRYLFFFYSEKTEYVSKLYQKAFDKVYNL